MIKLFTDSSSNLPLEVIDKYGIGLITLTYTVDGVETVTSPDFDGKKYYDAMRNGAVVKTSMINMGTFTEVFEKCVQDGDDVIFIGMAGGISGTTGAAKLAADEICEKYPSAKIAVIDSLAASLGEGFQVIEAAELIEKGEPFIKVVKKVELHKKNMCQFFTVDDLKYLKNTGRVSNMAAAVGTILNIKPILKGSPDGYIIICGKVRGAKKSYDTIVEQYDSLVLDRSEKVGIAHADNPDAVEYIEGRLRELGFTGELMVVPYEPIIGSHVGPGALAMFFYGEHK